LLEALDAIAEHPLVGGGLGSTVSIDIGKASVVHNAYLQSWADLGPLAAVSFLALSLGWMRSLPRALRRLRALRSPHERALYYGAVCGLFLFCGLSFFHPLSVQISVWAFFVIPAALYAQLLGPRAALRPGDAALCGPGGAERSECGGRYPFLHPCPPDSF
jgi:O-antigen ligase